MPGAPLRYRMNLAASVSLCAMTVFTVAIGAMVAGSATGNGPPVVLVVAWLGFFAVAWCSVLLLAIIEVRLWLDDGRLEFRSFLRKRATNVSDVVEIDCRLWTLNRGGVNIRYRRGGYRRAVARLGNEKAARALVERIEQCNPAVDIKSRPFDPWRTT